MIIEMGMESQSFYFGLIILAAFLFIAWFVAGRKGGYGPPTVLNLKKGESKKNSGVLQSDTALDPQQGPGVMRDVTASAPSLEEELQLGVKKSKDGSSSNPKSFLGLAGIGVKPPKAPAPPAQANFVYNGHDWDAFEVLGVSPYASFSEITRVYQIAIKKADAGKHEFLQSAYMAILKIK